MNRCLVTFGVGEHAELLEIALPSFERFASRHGYELLSAVLDPVVDLPPSWWKIPILQDVLEDYDEALWIDADVVIVDDSADIEFPEDSWQALVEHRTGDGEVPNLGVWYLRAPMQWILPGLWAMREEYADHGWWEQAAMLDLLGYDHHTRPVTLDAPTELFDHTHFLETGWNVHPNDTYKSPHPRFMHATMHPDRAQVMREWAAQAVPA